MKGRRSVKDIDLLGNSDYNKWKAIKNMMNARRIGVLALQETHLDSATLAAVKTTYSRWLMIYNSADLENPTGVGGVAFVINRCLVPIDSVSFKEVIPGRAASLSVKWHGEQRLSLLNIYGPNKAQEQTEFWPLIQSKLLTLAPWSPDFMLGDFNVTEEDLDRAPPRADDWRATDALRDFRIQFNLSDSWRETFPLQPAYTFRSHSRGADGVSRFSQSRLDRIYVKRNADDHVFEWDHTPCEVPTDHDLVSVRFSPENAPEIGPGRPTMPVYMVHRGELMAKIEAKGEELLNRYIFGAIDKESGLELQRSFETYKTEIGKLWMKEHKEGRLRMDARIKFLQQATKNLVGSGDFGSNEHKRSEEAMINKEIKHLYKKRNWKRLNASRAKWAIKSETVCKDWFSLGKEKKPRDMMYRLKSQRHVGNSPVQQYTTRTYEMADIARNHHETLQKDGIPEPESPETRARDIDTSLEQIPESQKLSADQIDSLNCLVKEVDVRKSLRKSKRGVATGMDGLPTELWRKLDSMHAANLKVGAHGFDVVKLLTLVYWSIQKFGLASGSAFTKGWMCPIYKKNDKCDISNYRPITVLNSDYKVFTKTLSENLAKVIKTAIHPDQAGFIAGRSILDQVELSKSIIAFAETSESDGAIVALDQEKAYDKIRHDYLFRALREYGFPEIFISTVQHLYSSAETEIAINGIHSQPYKVERGVRQGDPLSCLLFNLAIEPLACAIRNSPNIKGIRIPGLDRKLAIALFADDATVYLSKDDSFDDLKAILDSWCAASGAKFNIAKTEVLPIGSDAYRLSVADTRRINVNDEAIADHIHIARDGEWIRVLGAPLGNDFDEGGPWGPTIEKIERALEGWKRLRPTLQGKRLVIQAVVGGMSQYRTAVQGMPEKALKEIRCIIRNFVWEGKRPLINEVTLQLPKDQGGLGLLDPVARNEAIDVERLRRYLNLGPNRATWAYVVDATINIMHPGKADMHRRQNPFSQNWPVPVRGRGWGHNLPSSVTRMLRVADKYNVQVEGLRFDESVLGSFPAWHHVRTNGEVRQSKATQCLFETHGVRSLADLIRVSQRLQRELEPDRHVNYRTCKCNECKADRAKSCEFPWKCAEAARKILEKIQPKMNGQESRERDGLSLSPNRKAKNRKNLRRRKRVRFDPSVTISGGQNECIRIFVDPFRSADTSATRPKRPAQGVTARDQKVVVYTDGSSLDNGTADAKCGAGVWFGENDSRNISIRPPTEEQTNQAGEIAAVILAVQSVPDFVSLQINSDSLTTIEGLTKHLEHWEDTGWIGVKNSELLKVAAYNLRRRSAPTEFQWVKGHSGIAGNDGADALAGEAAERNTPDTMDMNIPLEYKLTGAKLSAMTQALAYKEISRRKITKPRRRTAENMAKIQSAIKDYAGSTPTTANVWKSRENDDLGLKIRQFIYKSIHGIHKIGEYWDNIPGHRSYSSCKTCGMTETFAHIMFECASEAREAVWALAENAWDSSRYEWPMLTEGLVMGVGLLKAIPKLDQPTPMAPMGVPGGASRLLRILISESAFVIWKIRNDLAIAKKRTSARSATAKWRYAMEDRLRTDRLLASRDKEDRSAWRVKGTWSGALIDIEGLPENWLTDMTVEVRVRVPSTGRFFSGSSPTLPVILSLPSATGCGSAFSASDTQ
jgi:ribonuclease HI/exonuclease III